MGASSKHGLPALRILGSTGRGLKTKSRTGALLGRATVQIFARAGESLERATFDYDTVSGMGIPISLRGSLEDTRTPCTRELSGHQPVTARQALREDFQGFFQILHGEVAITSGHCQCFVSENLADDIEGDSRLYEVTGT